MGESDGWMDVGEMYIGRCWTEERQMEWRADGQEWRMMGKMIVILWMGG